MWTIFVTKDGTQFRYVHILSAALYQALVDGIEHGAACKKQVAAIFDLINRIPVAELRTQLFVQIQGKTQTA